MKNILNQSDWLQITERINSLTTQSKRRWGKMNVEQMLAHCEDQIRLALGEKQPHEKPNFFNRNVMKYFGLWLPRIPLRNLKAPVDMNQKFYGTASSNISTEQQNLIGLLNTFRTAKEDFIFQPHPMYGKLNRKQWGRFMYVHIDHHLRQFNS
ncbi:MAG: DUF1569 domain-containing protein [Chitinophagaceae bacterium]|nr:DUF1569 domain-containing protein [Chitinophagaceae bacterium]